MDNPENIVKNDSYRNYFLQYYRDNPDKFQDYKDNTSKKDCKVCGKTYRIDYYYRYHEKCKMHKRNLIKYKRQENKLT